MSRTNLVIRESHITDGQIGATVSLGEETVGNLSLTLAQWDTLRLVYGVTVMNLSEQSDAEDDPGE